MAVIYSKTDLGQSAMQNRSAALSPRQRSAFIMFDGKRSVDDILRMTAGIGVTRADVDHMVTEGLLSAPAGLTIPASSPSPNPALIDIALEPETAPAPVAASSSGQPSAATQASYLKAYPVATRLTASLGLRGFRLNLAVEAAGDLQKLRELAPKIKDAVGADKFKELEDALR